MGARWQYGRFLRGRDGGWYALSHDGLATRVEQVVVPHKQMKFLESLYCPEILGLVDNVCHDGPIGVTTKGHLYDLAHDRLIRVVHHLAGSLCIMAIARSGERVVIAQTDNKRKMAVIDVPGGTARKIAADAAAHAEPDLAAYVARARNVSHRFKAVCLDEGRCLAIQRVKGSFAALELDRRHREIVLVDRGIAAGSRQSYVEFQEIESPGDAGYTLHAAAWNDGSRAVLDSRGMLHLRSSDLAIPELTLVLCTGAVAGWCADGRWFGPTYFIGEHPPTPGAVVYEEIIKPFVARLR